MTVAAADRLEKSKRIILWIIVIGFCFGFSLLLNRSATIPRQSDLYSRWYAARMLFQESRSLYDPQNGIEAAREKFLPTSGLEAGFYYPAYLLVFIGPLSLLDFSLAHLVWTFTGLLFLLAGLWKAREVTGWPGGSNLLAVVLLLALVFIPVIQHTIWSQFDTIGVAALIFSLDAIQKKRYFIAGVLCAGLVFKPQGTLVVLMLVLGWALLRRERWSLLAGFGAACTGLLTVSLALEPGWIPAFLRSLGEYGDLPYQIFPAINRLLPFGPVSGVLLVGALAGLMFRYRNVNGDQPVFTGLVLLGLAVNWLVIPVIGMLYLVMFPCALILLLGGLAPAGRQREVTGWMFTGLYAAGFLGFVVPLVAGGPAGMHIQNAELAYKIAAPVVLGLLSTLFIHQREPLWSMTKK